MGVTVESSDCCLGLMQPPPGHQVHGGLGGLEEEQEGDQGEHQANEGDPVPVHHRAQDVD